ncbi:hypothetical protein CRG98_019993 [Punica granatum]|uniref:Uncharacterized protein n=1 Tax=Punica granatum TaxID=22663 RepID=A0A2I0JTF8_PUNGR|nr:hypothetical protein CRG98_019993 [Punica granatum]
MDPTDFYYSLAELLNTQMTWDNKQAAMELPTNQEESQDTIPLTLLIKSFGFKPPPPKAIIPRLLQAWNIRKGVIIAPKKYAEDLLVCLFKDKRDMTYVERERAWSVQGAHVMISRWDKGLALEEVKFDSISFWIQLRGILPELLSTDNITKLAAKAGRIVEVDWKDTPSLPKWYVTLRALVRIPVAKPICPGRFINRKSGPANGFFSNTNFLKPFAMTTASLATTKPIAPLKPQLPPAFTTLGSALTTNPIFSHHKSQLLRPHRNIPPTAITKSIAPIDYAASRTRILPLPQTQKPKIQETTVSGTRWNYPAKSHVVPTVGDSIGEEDRHSEESFLHRGYKATLHHTRPAQEIGQGSVLLTDTLYSGLMEEQAQIAAQFQAKPSPDRSPQSSQPICKQSQGRDHQRGPVPRPSPIPPPSPDASAARIFPRRKRRNDTSMDEFLRLSAPYARIFNKMARTIGEAMQEDWNA